MRRSLYLLVALALTLAVLAGCNRTPARTDAQVASDVQNKIYSDAAVESRGISVRAANGVVTLSGDVTSDAERNAAANDAGAIDGVKTVINNLQVQQAEATPPPAPQPAPTPAQKPSPGPKKKQEASARHHHHASAGQSQSQSQSEDSADSNLQAENAPPVAPQPPEPPPQPAPPQPPPPPPPPQKVTIPAGTQLSVRLNDPLNSETNKVGDTFHGTLSSPIVIDGETAIPSGADVVGRVVNVQSAGRLPGSRC